MTLLGPLFRYELTRLARRGLQPKLRAVFAGLLLGALLLTYLQSFPGVNPARVIFSLDQSLPIEHASRFGERFLTAFLVVQLVVVVVATPALAGSAMAEEKERRSLDFLLSSPLTSREIVFGKMAARLVYVAGVVLTGLPVLVLTMFFGGVDGATLLAGYGITLLTMLSLGAYSLNLAVIHDTLRAVLFRAYGAVLGLTLFGFCCGCFFLPAYASPFSTLYHLLTGWEVWFGVGPNLFAGPAMMVLGYSAVHVPLGALFLWRAVANLRTPIAASEPRPLELPHSPPRTDLPQLPLVRLPEERPIGWELFDRRFRTVPALKDDEDPLEWKERWFGGRIWPHAETTEAALLFVLLAVVVGGFMTVLVPITVHRLDERQSLATLYGPLCQILFTILLPGIMLGVGVVTTGTIARERQRQTLESLLSAPVERRAILRAKARTALREVLPVVWILAAFYVMALVTGGVMLPSLVVAPLLIVGWGGLAAAGGMWLSVRCANPTRAMGYYLLALLSVCVLPPLANPLVAQSVTAYQPSQRDVEAWLDGFGPAGAAWNTLASYRDVIVGGIWGALIGATSALLLALLLWRDAVRRFENEGK